MKKKMDEDVDVEELVWGNGLPQFWNNRESAGINIRGLVVQLIKKSMFMKHREYHIRGKGYYCSRMLYARQIAIYLFTKRHYFVILEELL
jgi:hypothetical protein